MKASEIRVGTLRIQLNGLGGSYAIQLDRMDGKGCCSFCLSEEEIEPLFLVLEGLRVRKKYAGKE